jgi:hypothetical protein
MRLAASIERKQSLPVVLEPEAERRVLEQARDSGMSEAEFVRMLIERSLDDLDGVQIALGRLDVPFRP